MNSVTAAGFGAGIRRAWMKICALAGDDGARMRAKMFAAMFVLSRARVGPGLAPFAAAYFAVNLESGPGLGALLAGCLAGAVITGADASSLFTPAGCAVTLSMWLLWDRLRHSKWGASMDGSVLIPVSAALAVLLPGLAAAGYDPGAWVGVLMTALAAAAMAMGRWLRLSKGLSAQGLFLWAAAGVALFKAVYLDPGIAAVFFAAAASRAGRGAVTGAALGAVGLVCGGNGAGAVLAACAGAAGDVAHMLWPGRMAHAAAVTAAAAFLSLWHGAPPLGMAACILASLLPDRVIDRLSMIIAPARSGGEQLAAACRARTETRLRALSDAFCELGQACGADDPAFGEQQLISGMRAALCTGCREYEKCWPGRDSRAVKLFCQLMTAAIERGGSPFDDGEVPPEVVRICRRGMLVPARLGGMLADFAAQRHRRVRLMGARRLLSVEFSQAAEIINAMAEEQSRPVSVRDGAAARVRGALAGEDIGAADVMAIYRDRLEVMVESSGPWTPARLAKARGAVSKVLGKPFSASLSGANRAIFTSGSAMQAPTAASMLPADPDEPCGDSHMVRDLGDGRVLVALSDGMGSGEAAAAESQRVLRLIFSLLRAGIPRDMALAAVNGVMLARGGEEMFATVDMLLVDLSTGRGEFTKLSACRSYIFRGGKMTCVEGGRLPLGILEQVQPARTEVKLKPGDTVVMMTDGVADSLPEDILEELMKSAADFSPAAMSEALVNAAAARAPRRRDDMTALCVKLCS